jgi:hypothetical protein
VWMIPAGLASGEWVALAGVSTVLIAHTSYPGPGGGRGDRTAGLAVPGDTWAHCRRE